MSLLADIKDMTLRDVSVGLLSLLLSVTPGFLILFLYDRELFIALDIGKLIALSFSVVAPFVVINFFIFQKAEDSIGARISSSTYLVLSIFASVLVIDLSLLCAYVFRLEIKSLVICTVLMQLILSFILYFVQRYEKTQ